MKANKTQIKKANKGLNSRGLNMTLLSDGNLHVGIVSILDMRNEDVLNTLDHVRKSIRENNNLNEILWMSFFN
tara:strand:- start:576 stop:794 length:219 start_codon:yes stop_codon:yes gene_type:complete